jgi:putative RNA 2'-phosphotransferase
MMERRENEIRYCPEHGHFRGQYCFCGQAGEFILPDYRSEKLGRIVSGALRHFTKDMGLEMDLQGWVDLGALSEAVRERYPWANDRVLDALFKSDVKQRYQVEGDRVRARYGHSVSVELDYPDNTQSVLYYGTSEEESDRILELGIKPQRQTYVHLSKTLESAVVVACVRTDSPVILLIDAAGMQSKGIQILDASPLCLTHEVLPEFISS